MMNYRVIPLLCYVIRVVYIFFYICTVHRDIIKVFYSPTTAQVIVWKNNIKIYIKIAPTCFGAVTTSSGSALFVLAEVTLIKMVS